MRGIDNIREGVRAIDALLDTLESRNGAHSALVEKLPGELLFDVYLDDVETGEKETDEAIELIVAEHIDDAGELDTKKLITALRDIIWRQSKLILEVWEERDRDEYTLGDGAHELKRLRQWLVDAELEYHKENP